MRAKRTTILSGSWTSPPEFELCPKIKITLRFNKVEVFYALEWRRLSSHTLNNCEQMVRYYGYYSNVARGKRKKADSGDVIPCILESELTDTTAPTAPTVTTTSLEDGSTVSGDVVVAASATDDRGVNRVDFYLNGTLLESCSSESYSMRWNTHKYAERPTGLRRSPWGM